jgi:hypothetical protein
MYPLIFGPTEQDLAPANHVREHWLASRDVILPSRSTLADPRTLFSSHNNPTGDEGEPAASRNSTAAQNEIKYHQSEASRNIIRREATREDLKMLHTRQRLSIIDEEVARSHQYLPAATSHSVVLGPQNAQYMSKIDACYGMPIQGRKNLDHAAWPHRGWLMNLGEKIQAMSWAPISGKKQYLAITTRCTPSQREFAGVTQPQYGPAFNPSAAYPSCIQLWSFDAVKSDDGEYLTLDTQKPPRLEIMVGIRCGNIKDLKWAPTSPLCGDPDAPRTLAILSTDSHVRILSFELSHGSSTTYTELEAAAMDITIPTDVASSTPITGSTQAVFTTVTWGSTKEIILGTSTGHIHIYNIYTSPSSSSSSPQPFFTHAIQPNYITALTCTLPPPLQPTSYSTQAFVASSSTNGDVTLTCLNQPTTCTITTPRARLPSRLLAYSPLLRTFLTCYEPSARNKDAGFTSSSTLACHHLRRFYTTSQLALLPLSRGSVTTLGVSMWHPSVLIGNAAGDVWAMNYARKVLVGRAGRKEKGPWLGRILGYDWRPDLVREVDRDKKHEEPDMAHGLGQSVKEERHQSKADLFHGLPTRKGVSRLTFGFKPEPVNLARNPGGKGEDGTSNKSWAGKSKKRKKVRGDVYKDDGIDDGAVDSDADVDMLDGEQLPAEEQARGAAKKGKAKAGAKVKGDEDMNATGMEVIFEEEQAVTAMEWSVNRQTAGWAAIGWGSGLVMVRDLSVEI